MIKISSKKKEKKGTGYFLIGKIANARVRGLKNRL